MSTEFKKTLYSKWKRKSWGKWGSSLKKKGVTKIKGSHGKIEYMLKKVFYSKKENPLSPQKEVILKKKKIFWKINNKQQRKYLPGIIKIEPFTLY